MLKSSRTNQLRKIKPNETSECLLDRNGNFSVPGIYTFLFKCLSSFSFFSKLGIKCPKFMFQVLWRSQSLLRTGCCHCGRHDFVGYILEFSKLVQSYGMCKKVSRSYTIPGKSVSNIYKCYNFVRTLNILYVYKYFKTLSSVEYCVNT